MRSQREGFSLWELAIGILLVSTATGALTLAVRGRLEAIRGARARLEMAAIREGCRQYDALNGTWPGSWVELREVLRGMDGLDPWGRAYILASDERRARVTAWTPVGPLTMSTGRVHGGAGRLAYEQRNVYGSR